MSGKFAQVAPLPEFITSYWLQENLFSLDYLALLEGYMRRKMIRNSMTRRVKIDRKEGMTVKRRLTTGKV